MVASKEKADREGRAAYEPPCRRKDREKIRTSMNLGSWECFVRLACLESDDVMVMSLPDISRHPLTDVFTVTWTVPSATNIVRHSFVERPSTVFSHFISFNSLVDAVRRCIHYPI